MAETVLTVGGGGREHALMLGLQDSGVQLLSTQGNAGMKLLGESLNIGSKAEDVAAIADAAQTRNVDLVVVGPETPLIAGLGDVLRERNIPTVGFNGVGAQLEGSKAFAVDFARRWGIAVPRSYVARDLVEAHHYMQGQPASNYVIKADGEAGGKGVSLPNSEHEAYDIVNRMMADVDNLFGEAGKTIVFQERLTGPEVSMFALLDGSSRATILGYAQDHKRLLDNDQGPNTGGMGAYSPVPETIVSREQIGKMEEALANTIAGMQKEGIASPGLLYLGFMLAEEYNNNPVLMEYNVRFGDPEAQVVLTLLRQGGLDLYELFNQAAHGALEGSGVTRLSEASGRAALTVCLAANGYPDSKHTRTGDVIYGLDKEYHNAIIHHGGTKRRSTNGPIETSGGRVLYATGFGTDIHAAARAAYSAIGENGVHFDGMQYRRDIGYQALRAA